MMIVIIAILLIIIPTAPSVASGHHSHLLGAIFAAEVALATTWRSVAR